MDLCDVVLSEVHLGYEALRKIDDQYIQSRFVFKNELNGNRGAYNNGKYTNDDAGFIKEENIGSGDTNEDEDDDLDPPRRRKQEDVIIIQHRLETPLREVGGQVWLASLLMADLILHQPYRFRNNKILELGAGVGLDSVVLRMFASKVICTDFLPEALKLCEVNVNLNKHLRKPQIVGKTSYNKAIDKQTNTPTSNNGIKTNLPENNVLIYNKVYENCNDDLDVNNIANPINKIDGNSKIDDKKDDTCSFLMLDWTKSLQTNIKDWPVHDQNVLKSLDVIVASDVVYSEDLTSHLFENIAGLVECSMNDCVTVLISVEKRLNFSLADAEITCPAYNHFRDLVQEMCTIAQQYPTQHDFTCTKIENIPQFFKYHRSPYLEMWQIQAKRMKPREKNKS